jgi:hypothetical protein
VHWLDFNKGILSLKTFYSLFQIAFFLLVSLTATRLSSPDTPAAASCKELLIALHNSLLIVLLDLLEQSILLLEDEWVGRLLELKISHHWRCGKKLLMFPVLKFHCQLHLKIRPFHGMQIHDLGMCVCYRARVQFLYLMFPWLLLLYKQARTTCTLRKA